MDKHILDSLIDDIDLAIKEQDDASLHLYLSMLAKWAAKQASIIELQSMPKPVFEKGAGGFDVDFDL